jgi:hypothetical protein
LECVEQIVLVEWFSRGARNGLGPGEWRARTVAARRVAKELIQLEFDDGGVQVSLRDTSRRYARTASIPIIERALAELKGPARGEALQSIRALLLPIAEVLEAPQVAIVPQDVTDLRLLALITNGENSFVEFKESLLWALADTRPNIRRDEGERVAVLELAGFANAQGGTLILGVRDDGTVLGLQPDLVALERRLGRKATFDDWELRLRSKIGSFAGGSLSALVTTRLHRERDLVLCVASVLASMRPIFFSDGANVDFPVRTGNETRRLNVREAIDHYVNRFRDADA